MVWVPRNQGCHLHAVVPYLDILFHLHCSQHCSNYWINIRTVHKNIRSLNQVTERRLFYRLIWRKSATYFNARPQYVNKPFIIGNVIVSKSCHSSDRVKNRKEPQSKHHCAHFDVKCAESIHNTFMWSSRRNLLVTSCSFVYRTKAGHSYVWIKENFCICDFGFFVRAILWTKNLLHFNRPNLKKIL